CVETKLWRYRFRIDGNQPPSGGCVLKRRQKSRAVIAIHSQPPSGGCVLKRNTSKLTKDSLYQPPSGGCVLKQVLLILLV
ncbi:hypothetical protein ACTHS7_12770, partial [Neisseria sp. P0015.S009]|uniref:hypothetical protein n=1 Tax=Neisseria sp. P0015.S009 TaxID=3436765 RepID=UPI003F7FDD2A